MDNGGKIEEEKRTITGIDREKEITEKPRPSIFYKKTRVNDNDTEETIEVVGHTLQEAKETFKEIKKHLEDSK